MHIISWNVQGVKKAQVLQEIQFLKSTHKPQILFLQETLVNERNILDILPKLGFDHFDYVEPVNHSGGIAVLWDNGLIHASVLNKEPRAIHLLVYDPAKQCSSVVSGIYAPARLQDKDSFWNHLVQMNTAIDLPWCIIGDCNELANPSEKRGGQRLPPSKFRRLNNFMDTINAVSVPFIGYPFTWKRRIHSHLIYERLDRAILRSDWINLYPESIIKHGTFSCSDHCPVIFSAVNPINRRKNLPFRFQNYWCQYRQLDLIVGRQWKTSVHGTKMFTIAQKLKQTKQHIKVWAKQFLGNNQRQLQFNAQKIDQIEKKLFANPDSPRLNGWLHRMLRQREKLLLFSQKYWGNFRRKKWLVTGDRNSRFFHQQARTKRKRKLVCKIKNDCGAWIDDPQDIATKFV